MSVCLTSTRVAPVARKLETRIISPMAAMLAMLNVLYMQPKQLRCSHACGARWYKAMMVRRISVARPRKRGVARWTGRDGRHRTDRGF